ncbi:flagellar associated protein [Moniliophthora roreri]|nr:flagellar associated protein [Moniliophthora roreri]
MTTQSLDCLHFNDCYRVGQQKLSKNPEDEIDVTQFATMMDDIRRTWPLREDGRRDGLTLFSGDLFSPSVESTVTRGSHLVPVMNHLAPDISLTGNHDFDFGYPHLSKLVQDTKFPWLLSNIIDSTTSKVPEHLHEFQVLERAGLKIGIIGLVEREWIATVSSWPPNFEFRDMKETGIRLSKLLRDPQGQHKCKRYSTDEDASDNPCCCRMDLILSKDLLALSPSAQDSGFAYTHGVDILLGGHDHMYYVSKGINSWDGWNSSEAPLGSEGDNGEVLVVKSGMDFRDLSAFSLVVESTPEGSVRKKVIKSIIGRRRTTKPGSPSSKELSELLKDILSSVSKSLKAPVCKSKVTLDLRSRFIRVDESAAANWFADIIRHSYDDALCMKGCGGADAVLICAGTLRGDSQYGPGIITLGDILEILPFDDPIVVIEVDGATIWDALESALETWPAQEGYLARRFPVVSGIRVSWDSRREKGQRVLGIWLTKEMEDSMHGSESGHSTPRIVDGEPIQRSKTSRKYKIVTREYMAQGHDGFTALTDQRYLVDDESGQPMSTIVRKYLLGSQFVNRMTRLVEHPSSENLRETTKNAILRERARNEREKRHQGTGAAQLWKHAANVALRWSRSKAHYQEQLQVSTTEHMSDVDAFDGKEVRAGRKSNKEVDESASEDLLVIEPMVDGRLKDEGRE